MEETKHLRDSREVSPSLADNKKDALRLLGNTAFRNKDFNAAETHYTQCIEMPGNENVCQTLALSNRAQVRLKLGNYKEALADATAALKLDPSSVKAQHRQVTALVQLGDPQAAQEAAARLKAGSKDTELIAELDTLLRKAGSSKGAAESSGKPERTLEVAQSSKLWADCREKRPQLEWFPAPLRQDWQWVPTAVKGTTENLLLLFHGLGDTPGPYAKLARTMALPNTASLALAGPQTLDLEAPGTSWFQETDDDWQALPVTEAFKRLKVTRGLLTSFLEALHGKGGWPYSRIHLFGFSQGGTVALDLAGQFRGQSRLGSCVSISGPLLGDPWESDASSGKAAAKEDASLGTPILMTHGQQDDVVPRSKMEDSKRQFSKHGSEVGLVSIKNKGHSMIGGEEEMRVVMTFWAKHLKSGAPEALKGETIVEVEPSRVSP